MQSNMNNKPIHLGNLQQLTMLAVARLRGDAFGSAIQDELLRVSGREVSVATVYVTLVRLEEQGLVTSTSLAPEEGKGGRGKRIFELTSGGWEALETSRHSLEKMWEGVEPA
ncbi:MAG: PadR family transcriptional regulator [Gemmatimonadota bacterium]|jgi:DNA-binding PadR family transcriptional regulator